MSTVRRMTGMSPCPRTRNVTAVAHASAASTKNCQGCRLVASVEVAELIVEALLESRISGARRIYSRVVTPRQPNGREAHDNGAAGANQIREEPRQAIESLVDRGTEDFLSAVFLDESCDDRIARLALL